LFFKEKWTSYVHEREKRSGSKIVETVVLVQSFTMLNVSLG